MISQQSDTSYVRNWRCLSRVHVFAYLSIPSRTCHSMHPYALFCNDQTQEGRDTRAIPLGYEGTVRKDKQLVVRLTVYVRVRPAAALSSSCD